MRILLVDDHSLFREGLKLLLADLAPETDFLHADSCEAAQSFDESGIDLVLLDFHLPGLSDRSAVLAIRNHFSQARLVIVSGEEEPATIRMSIADGASGYIPKSSTPEVMIAALQLILAGGSYLPPHVLDDVAPGDSAGSKTEASIKTLSQRQSMVLSKAVEGKLNKVIASELNISEGTVKAHLSAAFRILGARNRTEAVYIASKLKLNLLDTPSD